MTGTSGPLSRSTTVTLTVTRPDFTVAVTPAAATVTRGQAASFQVSVAPVGGFTGSVGLSVSGSPSGSTTSAKPAQVIAPGTATVRISTGVATKRGTFPVVITGTSGTLVHQQTVILTVR